MSLSAAPSDPAFDAALDACCARVRAGEPLEQCIGDYPADYQAELRRLVPVAGRVASLPLTPSPAFEERLRTALLKEHPTETVGAARRTAYYYTATPAYATLWESFKRRLAASPALRVATAAALILLLIGGGTGAVLASDGSLPDSPLYQVKEARESAELWLARDDQARANVYIRQIRRRAVELGIAIQTHRRQAVIITLSERLVAATDQLVDQALAIEAGGNPRPALRARVLLIQMEGRLTQLIPRAPADVQLPLLRLEQHLEQQQSRLPSGERQPGPRVPAQRA